MSQTVGNAREKCLPMSVLFEEYLQLSDDGKLGLEALAFYGASHALAPFTRQFNQIKDELGLSRSNVRSVVEHLYFSEMIEGDLESFRCPPSCVEDIALAASQRGTAKAICRILGNSPARYSDPMTEARRSRHTGKPDYTLALFRHDGYQIQFVRGLQRPETLQQFPTDLALKLAEPALANRISALDPLQDWLDWLIPLVEGAPRGLADLLALACLLRGEVDDLKRALASHEELFCSFFVTLLSDDLALGHKKITQRLSLAEGAVASHPIQDFLYALASINLGQEALLTTRRYLLDSETVQLIDWWRTSRSSQGSRPPHGVVQILSYGEPMFRLFAMFGMHWNGLHESLDVGLLEREAQHLKQAGYRLFLPELEALRLAAEGKPALSTPILGLLPKGSLWNSALTQLERWSEQATASSEPVREHRIVWMVNFANGLPLDVTPRLQKLGKSGKWSSGKVMTYEALQESIYLDADDHTVLKEWNSLLRQRYQHRRYWLTEVQLLPLLMDHPRVFHAERTEERVHLSKVGPRLQLVPEQDGMRLSLSLGQSLDEDHKIRELSKGHYGICQMNARLAELDSILGETGVVVPEEGLERVQRSVEKLLQQKVEIAGELIGSPTEIETRDADATIRIRLTPQRHGLMCDLCVQPFAGQSEMYEPGGGPEVLTVTLHGRLVQMRRSFALEQERWDMLFARLPFLGDRAAFLHPGEVLELLAGVKEFPEGSVVVEWPEGEKLKLRDSLDAKALQIRATGRDDWFAIEGSLQLSDGEKLQLTEVLAGMREGQAYLQLSDSSYVTLTEELKRQLALLERAADQNSDGSFLLPSLAAGLLDDLEVIGDTVWSATRGRIEAAARLQVEMPESLRVTLRGYQEEGVRWLVRSSAWAPGVCLADDMGLGKTVQTLALLTLRKEEGPALVIAPTSVGANWLDETERFAPELRALSYVEEGRTSLLKGLGKGDVVVCTYGLLVRDAKALAEVPWGTVVLDEAQAIKNANTQRFKAAIALKAGFRVATTGTPVENHLDEVWALFRFLAPGLLGTRKRFSSRFVAGANDGVSRGALSAMVRPFLLRRLKSAVLSELPSRTDVTLKVELSREERVLYEGLRLQALERMEHSESKLFTVLVELTRLRRACCHPALVDKTQKIDSSKLHTFRKLLEEILEGGHKVLVFSQFVDHLKLATSACADLDARALYLDGSTPTKERAKLVKTFQEGEAEVFFISLKAGGFGLNLTAANYVIHLDPWWNPAVEDQASDRAHRMGQLLPVTVYRLIAKDTIEEKIVRMHSEKREMAEHLLSGTDQSTELDAEAILGLLRET